MNLLKVLKESFSFLGKYPRFFAPKFVSISIWNVFYILVFETILSLNRSNFMTQISSSLLPFASFIIVFSPVSVIVYSMYPTLVKSYKENNIFSFKTALKIAIKKFPGAILVFTIPIIVASVITAPFLGLAVVGYLTSQTFYLVLGGSISALLIFLFGIFFYFAPTSIIIKNIGVKNSIVESLKMGRDNFKEVGMITIFSFALLFVGYFFTGALRGASIFGFIVGRYLQATVGTYLTILNPDLYLDIETK